MFLYSISKGAIAGVVAASLATAGGAAWTLNDAVDRKADRAVTATTKAAMESGAKANASVGTGAAGATAHGGASGSGSAGADGTIRAGGTGGAVSAGVGVPKVSLPPVTTPGPGSLPGVTVPSVPSAPSLPSTPSLPSASVPSGPTTDPGVPGVTVPTVPGAVLLFREGSYTLVVPGTTAVSKQLCLKGEVNKCQAVSVPALERQEVTVRYSGNASIVAPTHSVEPCSGGLGVAVAGVTPGTTVTVEARGVKVTRTLGARETAQSASLCDG